MHSYASYNTISNNFCYFSYFYVVRCTLSVVCCLLSAVCCLVVVNPSARASDRRWFSPRVSSGTPPRSSSRTMIRGHQKSPMKRKVPVYSITMLPQSNVAHSLLYPNPNRTMIRGHRKSPMKQKVPVYSLSPYTTLTRTRTLTPI